MKVLRFEDRVALLNWYLEEVSKYQKSHPSIEVKFLPFADMTEEEFSTLYHTWLTRY